jgi:hypothetical protein
MRKKFTEINFSDLAITTQEKTYTSHMTHSVNDIRFVAARYSSARFGKTPPDWVMELPNPASHVADKCFISRHSKQYLRRNRRRTDYQ